MRRVRPPRSYRWLRPSPRFEKFSTTAGATVLAALLTVGAVAGTVLALWRAHWIDAVVYAVIAVACGAWLVVRARGRHGGPHPAG